MLYLTISSGELFDERTDEFIKTQERTMKLEHSLISISKWEAKYCKTFLGREKKTNQEILDYIRCMTIGGNIEPEVYLNLSEENIDTINRYIESPMSATFFRRENSPHSGEPMTSELIYYYMTAFNIPFDPCETWHLNRLLNLINIANIKNQPKKKRSVKEIAAERYALNEARRNKLGTTG